MIIDVHTHPWMTVSHPFHSRQAPLLEVMDEYKIDKSVLLSMSVEENEQVVQLVKEHPSRYIPFYWVELNLGIVPAITQLERDVKEHHFKGLKLYPYFSHIHANDPRMYPVYAKAAELGLVCLWHMGDVSMIDDRENRKGDLQYSPSALEIAAIAADFPELKIVMSHLGGNFYYEAIIVAERLPNIYLDTAWLHFYVDRLPGNLDPAQLIQKAVRILGAGRILYGGEGIWPQDVLDCDLSTDESADILGRNLAKLLNL